jgi:hypothetical protein
MTDHDYNNFYTPGEYESYQQCPLDNYGQTPEARLEETMIKFMEMQQQINQEQQQLNQLGKQGDKLNTQTVQNSEYSCDIEKEESINYVIVIKRKKFVKKKSNKKKKEKKL